MKRRELLELGLAAGTFLGARSAAAAGAPGKELLNYLCPPDNFPPEPQAHPSPKAAPFKAELFIPPVIKPVPKLDPPPDPRAHQRYEEFLPREFYELHEQELTWQYHPDPPYGKGSLSWGFNGTTPGPTYHARYGTPVLVRRFNDLPVVGQSKVTWALPSTSTHLHNGHTASESDGFPTDYIDSGEFWDHHYANYPSGGDEREKLTTLWYHDHRLDFTASNVYAGLAGFYLLFDQNDTGNENDASPEAWRLPSGEFDIPLLIHDVLFDQQGQVVFNPFATDGWLGDMVTVNRRIRPRLRVKRRKYRLRILNGGPSRFYRLSLDSGPPLAVITGDGNILPEPVEARSIYLSPGQRFDVIIDFKNYKGGTSVTLRNDLEQVNGRGPSGRTLDPPDGILRFDVTDETPADPSRIPAYFRPLPSIDLSEVKQRREWVFDYDGGLWTINQKVMEANRVDAAIELGSAEIWTFRNGGNIWSHPVHSHFSEFLILEVNGKPFPWSEASFGRPASNTEKLWTPGKRPPLQVFFGGPRRDVATLLPNDEIKVFMRWKDFLGKYVMHCHNVVHEDHAMMIRWDIVEPGRGFVGSRPASGDPPGTHLEERPGQATDQPSD